MHEIRTTNLITAMFASPRRLTGGWDEQHLVCCLSCYISRLPSSHIIDSDPMTAPACAMVERKDQLWRMNLCAKTQNYSRLTWTAADELSSSPKQALLFHHRCLPRCVTPVYRFFIPCRGSPELSIWLLCTPGKGFHHQTLQIQLLRLDAHQTQQITNGNDKLPQIVQQDSFSALKPSMRHWTNKYLLFGRFLTFTIFVSVSYLQVQQLCLEDMKPLFLFLIFLGHS